MKEIEVVQPLQMRGLRLFVDTVEYRAPHLHKELELIWILEGRLRIRSAQGACVAAPGDIAVLNPKQTHTLSQEKAPCTFVCIQVSPQFFAYGFPAVSGLRFDGCVVARTAHTMTPLLEALTRSCLQQKQGYELICAGQMHLLLHGLLQCLPHHILTESETLERDRRGERLDRLIDFVERNHHHKIALADFARQENRSMSYLSHFVKENLGQSFQEYVNAVRFQAACSLIAAGQDRLTDVCAEAGFSDYRYFVQTFRRRTGMTPEAYRAQVGRQGMAVSAAGAPSLEHIYTREEGLALFERLRPAP